MTGILACGLLLAASGQAGPPPRQTESLPFELLDIPPEIGLRALPEEEVHYSGAVRTREQFLELWNLQENVMSDFPRLFNWLIPDPPGIDFNRYTVLWFSNRGAGASFVELQKIVHAGEGDALEAHIKVVYSDFVSKKLNLWRIPKTSRPIVFKEHPVYDRKP